MLNENYKRVPGGVEHIPTGRFTSNEAIKDIADWANAADPTLVNAIFSKEDIEFINAEPEPWLGHDEAIAELQAWADSIPLVVGDFPVVTDFLGSAKPEMSLDYIYDGLGIKKEE